MELTRTFSISTQVVARELGGETVILDLASGAYFGLDTIGAQVWRLLDAGKPLSEICDAIFDEYEVAREELERDVLALVHDLEDRKLIL